MGALGVLVYEMEFGQSPFKGKNLKETFWNVLQKEEELSELANLVSGCWSGTPRGSSGTPAGQRRSTAPKSCCPAAWPGGREGGSRGNYF
jgi:hypothetical protein